MRCYSAFIVNGCNQYLLIGITFIAQFMHRSHIMSKFTQRTAHTRINIFVKIESRHNNVRATRS